VVHGDVLSDYVKLQKYIIEIASKTKSLKSLSPKQAAGHYRISPFGTDFAGQSRSKLRGNALLRL
jgi:hypothetical protein